MSRDAMSTIPNLQPLAVLMHSEGVRDPDPYDSVITQPIDVAALIQNQLSKTAGKSA
jgi:hypothetical protein